MIQIIKYSDNIKNIHYSSSSNPYLERNIMWSKGGWVETTVFLVQKRAKEKETEGRKQVIISPIFPLETST